MPSKIPVLEIFGPTIQGEGRVKDENNVCPHSRMRLSREAIPPLRGW